MTYQSKIKIERPPANALRVKRWADLPTETAPAQYEITLADGTTSIIKLAKDNRTLLAALINQPVYCASPVRISDRVCILRHEYGVPITKQMYANDKATGRAKFGVYFLDAKARRVSGGVK